MQANAPRHLSSLGLIIFILLSSILGVGCTNVPAPMCQVDADCGEGALCVRRRCAVRAPRATKGPTAPTAQAGLRQSEQTCDPRDSAWFVDRCAAGLHCARIGLQAPTASGPSSSLDLDGA